MIAAARLSTASNQRLEVIIVAVLCSGVIFELVRRKRLMERYALLWLLAGSTILVLGVWKGLLTKLSHAAGIYYAPSALFAVAFLFVLALLVHFSITISRLTDQNKVLAQKLALLEGERDGAGPADASPREPARVVSE
jgi:hypothetical protein